MIFLALLFTYSVSCQIATLPHDQVHWIDDIEADRLNHTLSRFKPLLRVADHTCLPFVAVDVEGCISKGLKPSGWWRRDSDCDYGDGQIYSRATRHGDGIAIMYAWFVPKAMTSNFSGTRYGWTTVVFFVKDMNSQRPDYISIYNALEDVWTPYDTFFTAGTRVMLQTQDLSAIPSQKPGRNQPLTDWCTMGDAARFALNHFDFGDDPIQRCPLNDANFESYVEAAV